MNITSSSLISNEIKNFETFGCAETTAILVTYNTTMRLLKKGLIHKLEVSFT